jgi:hypothetical protein
VTITSPSSPVPGSRPDARAAALRLARATIVVLAIAQLALYLVLAVRTIGYPYPLEWMEGGTVDVVERVSNGLPLYTRPTASYVPYIYPPLYYWVSAQAARIVGSGFVAPRLVSFLSICTVFVLIAAIIRRNGGDWIASLAGAALFAGTYESAERWFHLARVDSLFLALLLGGMCVLQSGSGMLSATAAGVLFALAFVTKQTTLLVVAPFVLVAALRGAKRPLAAALVFGTLVGATNIVMNARTDSWWHYFMYQLPLMHGPAVHGSYWFWRYDMAPVLPFALIATGVLLAAALMKGAAQWRWVGGMCIGAIAASWLARLHSGGAANSLMPAYAALAVAMPLAIGAFGGVWRLTASVMLILQLGLLLHTWTGKMPTEADRVAGAQYEEFLRRVDGDVIVWYQRFVQTRAGHRSWGLEMAAEDVIRANDPAAAAALQADVIRVCRDGQIAGVVDPPEWLRAAIAFGSPIELFNDAAVFRPVAGAAKRPTRYFPIVRGESDARAGAVLQRPDEAARDQQVQRKPSETERPAAK